MYKKLKYYSAYVPYLGILIIIWYSFWSKHPKEYCLEDDTDTLLVGLVQFSFGIVTLCELGYLQ